MKKSYYRGWFGNLKDIDIGGGRVYISRMLKRDLSGVLILFNILFN